MLEERLAERRCLCRESFRGRTEREPTGIRGVANTAGANINLDDLSAEELTALIRAAEERRLAKVGEAREALIREMRERAEALGLSLDQLVGGSASPARRKTRSDAGTSATVRYRGPEGETWSGRGRPPGWLVALERSGKQRDTFQV